MLERVFYLDPPYVHATRVSTSDYDFEMSKEQHKELLDLILDCEGYVMISGYPNLLYDRRLRHWRTVDKKIDNKASSAQRKPKKTERLWMNY